jgi:hypothetical protein
LSLAAFAARAAAAAASKASSTCHIDAVSKPFQAGWPAASAIDLRMQQQHEAVVFDALMMLQVP